MISNNRADLRRKRSAKQNELRKRFLRLEPLEQRIVMYGIVDLDTQEEEGELHINGDVSNNEVEIRQTYNANEFQITGKNGTLLTLNEGGEDEVQTFTTLTLNGISGDIVVDLNEWAPEDGAGVDKFTFLGRLGDEGPSVIPEDLIIENTAGHNINIIDYVLIGQGGLSVESDADGFRELHILNSEIAEETEINNHDGFYHGDSKTLIHNSKLHGEDYALYIENGDGTDYLNVSGNSQFGDGAELEEDEELVDGPDLNLSALAGNQDNPAIAINPENHEQIFAASNDGMMAAGLFAVFSEDGGDSWESSTEIGDNFPEDFLIADGTGNLKAASADASPTVSWDEYGNLFLGYIAVDDTVTPVNEVQQFDLGGATAGDFAITFDGQTTAAIKWNAAAGDVQTALNNAGLGDVTASGGPLPGTAVVLTFGGVFASLDVPPITIEEAGLTDQTVSISTMTEGVSPNVLQLALSTDGGETFEPLATLGTAGVSQPDLATGPGTDDDEEAGSVWASYYENGMNMVQGAEVDDLEEVGPFGAAQMPNVGQHADVAVGPDGQVVVTGQTNDEIRVATDPDGLGIEPFGPEVVATMTDVALMEVIPAAPVGGIHAAPGLAYDRSEGELAGRLYLVYTDEVPNDSDNTDVFLRTSDDDGVNWSPPIQVNDDETMTSQFFPEIAVDQESGKVGIAWLDARNDPVDNVLVELFATVSEYDGESFYPNVKVADEQTDGTVASTELGSYIGLAFAQGILVPAWPDNSNSTEDNPDLAGGSFDIYADEIALDYSATVAVYNGDGPTMTIFTGSSDEAGPGTTMIYGDLKIENGFNPYGTMDLLTFNAVNVLGDVIIENEEGDTETLVMDSTLSSDRGTFEREPEDFGVELYNDEGFDMFESEDSDFPWGLYINNDYEDEGESNSGSETEIDSDSEINSNGGILSYGLVISGDNGQDSVDVDDSVIVGIAYFELFDSTNWVLLEESELDQFEYEGGNGRDDVAIYASEITTAIEIELNDGVDLMTLTHIDPTEDLPPKFGGVLFIDGGGQLGDAILTDLGILPVGTIVGFP